MNSSWTTWDWVCYILIPTLIIGFGLLKFYSETFQQWWYNNVSIKLNRWMGMRQENKHGNGGHGHSHEHGHSHNHGHSHSHQEGHDHDPTKDKREAELEKHKQTLFKDLNTIISKSEELKKKGAIRILEIGTGYGANFKYYPENCQYIALDAFDGYKEKFMENLKSYPGIHLEKFVHRPGENMEGVENASVDVVIGTAVFCQVKNVEKVFKEIQRVLVPGGRFYYIDHIAAEPNSFNYYLQILLNPFVHFLFGGHIDRKIDQAVLKAGFNNVNQKYIQMNHGGNWFHSILAGRFVVGVAMK